MDLSRIKQKPYNILIIVVFFIILYYLTPFNRIVNSLRAPLFGAGSIFYSAGLGVDNIWIGITQGHALQKKSQAQELLIASLQSQNSSYQAKENFSNTIKTFDNLSSEMDASVVVSKVISYSTLSGEQVIYINKGEQDGILTGLPVITEQGIFIGKTIKTSKNVSTVLLATDDNSVIATTPSNNVSIQAIVRGKLGIGLIMELIPQDAEISVGDAIVTSLLESNTPPGLIIGTIASIDYIEGQLFKQANIKPMITTHAITTAGVILPIL